MGLELEAAEAIGDAGNLADWEGNLGGLVEFAHHPPQNSLNPYLARRLRAAEVRAFDGGFLTWGTLVEGAEVELAEGWRGRDLAEYALVFAALPDERTVLGLEFCRMNPVRGLLR